jgi:carboxypeptidase Taq
MKKDSLYKKNLAEIKEIISEAEYLKYTVGSLIYWDKITYMPPKGIDYRTKVMSFLADEQYKILSGERFAELVSFFEKNGGDRKTDAMIRRIRRNSYFSSAIPENEYREYIELIAVSERVWEKARAEDDFERFGPFLESIFSTFRKFASYWGDDKDRYDALLDYYEEGLTSDALDGMVDEIKPFLLEAVAKSKKAGITGHKAVRFRPASGAEQREKWALVLERLGFDFDAGRVDTGAHPTILANSPDDVRIVNSFREEDFEYGLTNILHSGGKGVYQQSISRDLLGSFLAEPPSFAMEESIGRFYENIIGRSKGFIENIFDDIYAEFLPEECSPQDIFTELNTVRPSAVRINADEFTYLLHVIIRYEIERDVIGGCIETGDIPRVWREKYREYLGVEPENDREGVLQDIHWAGGYVGYFPSYIVANLAAAQLKYAMERDIGDLDETVRRGDFDKVRDWLSDNIFTHGAVYSTEELIKRASGEPLKAEYYIEYLRKKLSEVDKNTKQSV